jgi:hypothetical protein
MDLTKRELIAIYSHLRNLLSVRRQGGPEDGKLSVFETLAEHSPCASLKIGRFSYLNRRNPLKRRDSEK